MFGKMFRDGQYLEVIKASDNCVGAAIVTVQEKTIEIKNKKVSTNKWLNLEDWVAVYRILKKALLQNSRNKEEQKKIEGCEWRKYTRQLQITYTFESSENVEGILTLPTIKVRISPASKRMLKEELHDSILDNIKDKALKKLKRENSSTSEKAALKKVENQTNLCLNQSHSKDFEEYVPDAPQLNNVCDLKYVPSKKSALQGMQIAVEEYTPAASDDRSIVQDNIHYIPNAVKALESIDNSYEPCALTTMSVDYSQEYVPNSRDITFSTEEYEPDFKCKSMKFDDSYVPSNLQLSTKTSKKFTDKHKNIDTRCTGLKTFQPEKKRTSSLSQSRKRKL